MTIDDVIDWVMCLLCNFFISDKLKITSSSVSKSHKISQYWSVKSVHVSKWIIRSYAEVTDRCGFDLLLRKSGSVSQFWPVFNFVSITQVVASQRVDSCTHESDFSKQWKIPLIFVYFLPSVYFSLSYFAPFWKNCTLNFMARNMLWQVTGSMPFIVFTISIIPKTHCWTYFW